jgi:hypothetical protein
MRKSRYTALLVTAAFSLIGLTVVLAAPLGSGGPDAFGYIYIDSDENGGPEYDWVEISTTGTPLALDDDDSSDPLPISFPFDFYGTEYSEFFINSNGFLSFGSGDDEFENNCPFSSSSPSSIVAIMWDDMDPGDTGALVYYQSYDAGNCPYDSYPGACTIAQYDEYMHYPGQDDINAGTWEAILFDNHSILLQYEDVGDEMGSNSTTGISNSDGSISLTYSACNTPGHLEGNLAIWFSALEADISVDPTSLESLQEPETMAMVPISITNNGDLSLSWEILEQVPGNQPVEDPDAIVERLNLPHSLPAGHPSLAPLGEAVMDGGFETGTPNTYWSESSINFGTPLCSVTGCGTGTGSGPNSGDWWVWFGGIAEHEEASVSQDLTIPATASDLTFYLEQIACDSPLDFLEVTIDDNQIFSANGTSAQCGVLGYSMQTVDISAYADDAVHTLEFHSEVFAQNEGISNFFIDDISIAFPDPGDCVPDVIPWVSGLPNSGITAPGETSVVEVAFDSTGVGLGVYTGTMCIANNDRERPELLVELTMTVEYLPTDVSLSELSAQGGSQTMGMPLWLTILSVAIVGGLIIRRRLSKKAG